MTGERVSVDPYMMLCAVRYALGRTSYMVGMVAEELRRVASFLPSELRVVIARDISEALNRNEAGDPCDQREWKACLSLLESLA